MIYRVPAGHTITATVTDGTGSIKQVEDGTIGAIFTSSVSYGPYYVERSFVVSDNAAVTVAAVTYCPSSVITFGDAAPVDAVKASLTVNPTGDENSLIFTAVEYGSAGNSISVEYVDPQANDAELSVDVFRGQITVSLATGEAGAITSTAAQVKSAIAASYPASRLVTVAIDDSDGVLGDGSGVVTAMAAAPLENGAGTLIGLIPGGLYIDTAKGEVYRNSGSTAAPAYTKLGDAA